VAVEAFVAPLERVTADGRIKPLRSRSAQGREFPLEIVKRPTGQKVRGGDPARLYRMARVSAASQSLGRTLRVGKEIARLALSRAAKREISSVPEALVSKGSSLGMVLSARDFTYQIGCVFRVDFLQQIGTVEFDGTRADFEKARNLLTGMSHNDFSQDPTFPLR
jgi:hypothetical protein